MPTVASTPRIPRALGDGTSGAQADADSDRDRRRPDRQLGDGDNQRACLSPPCLPTTHSDPVIASGPD